MKTRRWIAVWGLLAVASTAYAGEYSSPMGLKMTYPSYWKQASEEERQTLERDMTKSLGRRHKGSLKVDTFLYDPVDATRNVVVMVMQPMQINGLTVWAQEMTAEAKGSDKPERVSIHGREALLTTSTTPATAKSPAEYQMQVILPGDERTFLIVGNAKAYEARVMEPILGRIIKSAQVRGEPSLTLEERWAYRTRTQEMVGVGIAVGLGLMFWKAMGGRKRQRQMEA